MEVGRSDQDCDLSFEPDNDCFKEVHNTRVESEEYPLDVYLIAANEITLFINSNFGDEFSILAPGEGNIPLSIFNDCHCEELAHLYFFPTGKFSYKVQPDSSLSLIKYFNQRFLNYTQKFASDYDYVYFAHSVLLKLDL